MPEGFRSVIGDDFVDGLACAVCTSPNLRVNHLREYADFVSCDSCGSSFVVEEGGDRVLYGKLSELYADTEKVVLRNWVTLPVVARLASAERQRKDIALPDFREPALQAEEIESGTRAIPSDRGMADASEVDGEPQGSVADLVSGELFRVGIQGESVYFPMKMCAHCMEAQTRSRLSISGSLPIGGHPDRRRRAVFGVPLCAECRAKTTALSGPQKNARLQAHLTSMIVGLALLVAALALGVVNLRGNMLVGILLLVIIAVVGYLLPLGLLLPRARKAPPLREAYLARTTLRVRPPDQRVAETYFDFRNQKYAQSFWEANKEAAVAEVRMLKAKAESPPPDEEASSQE